jgi:hypothetical protein
MGDAFDTLGQVKIRNKTVFLSPFLSFSTLFPLLDSKYRRFLDLLGESICLPNVHGDMVHIGVSKRFPKNKKFS